MARFTNIRAFWEGLDAGAAERRREEELALKKKKEDQDFLFRQSADDRANSAELRTTEDFNLARVGKTNKNKQDMFAGETFDAAAPTLRESLTLNNTKQAELNKIELENQPRQFELFRENERLKQVKTGLDQVQYAGQQQIRAENPTTLDPALRNNLADLVASNTMDPDAAAIRLGMTFPEAMKGASLQAKAQYLRNSGKFLDTGAAADASLQATSAKYDQATKLVELKNDGTQAVADTRAQSAETLAAGKLAAKGGGGAPATPASRAAAQQAATSTVKGVFGQVVQPSTVLPTAPATVAPKAAAAPAAAQVAPTPVAALASENNAALQLEADSLASEIAAIRAKIPTRGSDYFAWNNSDAKKAYDIKAARLSALNQQLTVGQNKSFYKRSQQ